MRELNANEIDNVSGAVTLDANGVIVEGKTVNDDPLYVELPDYILSAIKGCEPTIDYKPKPVFPVAIV